ncbi:hypothetical protein CW304_28315 [Bacillus sp. UFRGS-B20]|nr:hypothetical protein CW304_28315 [Bacillus sp. UFRGS-B20]
MRKGEEHKLQIGLENLYRIKLPYITIWFSALLSILLDNAKAADKPTRQLGTKFWRVRPITIRKN